MDETYSRMKGERCYLYRAVDKHGQAIDFLLIEHRDKEAAVGVFGSCDSYLRPSGGFMCQTRKPVVQHSCIADRHNCLCSPHMLLPSEHGMKAHRDFLRIADCLSHRLQ